MKSLLFAVVLSCWGSAFGNCPEISGSYRCVGGEQRETDLAVLTSKEGGVIVSYILVGSVAGRQEMFTYYTDGVERKDNRLFPPEFGGTYSAYCSQEKLHVEYSGATHHMSLTYYRVENKPHLLVLGGGYNGETMFSEFTICSGE